MPLVLENEFGEEAAPPEGSAAPKRADWHTQKPAGGLGMSALRVESPVGSTLNAIHFRSRMIGVDDPQFDAFKHAKTLPQDSSVARAINEFPNLLVDINNEFDFDIMLEKVDLELQDRKTIQDGGILGMAAAMVAGFIDPINLVPVGGTAARSYKLGKSMLQGGLRTAAVGGLSMTASEAVLWSTQGMRTLGESATNVAAGTLLGGILGASAGALSARQMRKFASGLEADMDLSVPRGLGPGDEISVSGAALAADVGDDSNFGFGKMASELELEGALGATRFIAASRISPGLDILARSPSADARTLTLELFEMPLLFEGNAQGKVAVARPSVATVVGREEWRLVESLRGTKDDYLSYRQRMAGTSDEPLSGTSGLDMARQRGRDRLGLSGGEYMTPKQFRQEVGRALTNGDEVAPNRPAAAQAAKAEIGRASARWRENLFGHHLDILQSNGHLKGFTSPKGAISYLTRVYNKDAILKTLNADGKTFQGALEQWLYEVNPKLTSGERSLVAQQISSNTLGWNHGRINYEGYKINGVQALTERKLDANTDVLAPWLEFDIEIVGRSYHRTMTADAELINRFGSLDFDDWDLVKAMKAKYAERIAASDDPKIRTKLDRRLRRDLEQLSSMVQIMRHQHSNSWDPAAPTTRLLRAGRQTSLISQGGTFVVSSIPDVARHVQVHGLSRVLEPMLPGHMSATKRVKLLGDELKYAAVGVEMELDGRFRTLTEIGENGHQAVDTTTVAGRVVGATEDALDSATGSFGVVNAMHGWNGWHKRMAGMHTHGRIIHAIIAENDKRLGKGAKLGFFGRKRAESDALFLRRVRIDDAASARIYEQLTGKNSKTGRRMNAGRMHDHGGVKLAGIENWDDIPAREQFLATIRGEVDNIIITPDIADLPIGLQTNDLVKTIFLYRSFAAATATRVFLAGLQHRDMAALNGLILSFAMGALVYQIKSTLAGKETSDDPATWVRESIDRSGVMMPVSDTANILDKWNIGPNRAFGLEGVSRYSHQGPIDAMLGPVLGTARNAARAFTGATGDGDFTQGDANAARRLLPYQNIWYLQWIFNAFEEGIAGDLPRKRR